MKGVNNFRFSSLIDLGMMNANLTVKQVPKLKCKLSDAVDKSNFVGQKL